MAGGPWAVHSQLTGGDMLNYWCFYLFFFPFKQHRHGWDSLLSGRTHDSGKCLSGCHGDQGLMAPEYFLSPPELWDGGGSSFTEVRGSDCCFNEMRLVPTRLFFMQDFSFCRKWSILSIFLEWWALTHYAEEPLDSRAATCISGIFYSTYKFAFLGQSPFGKGEKVQDASSLSWNAVYVGPTTLVRMFRTSPVSFYCSERVIYQQSGGVKNSGWVCEV